MKKISIIFCTVLLVVSLNACFSTKLDGNRTADKSQHILEYTLLNTTDSQLLELKKGDVLAFEIVSESGKVNIIVQKDESEPIYQGTNIPTSSFNVEITEDGTYNCSVTGKKAKGSVSVKKEN